MSRNTVSSHARSRPRIAETADRYCYIPKRAKSTIMDSWMKDQKKYGDKDIAKLEKGSGFVKAWTLAAKWLYSVISW